MDTEDEEQEPVVAQDANRLTDAVLNKKRRRAKALLYLAIIS